MTPATKIRLWAFPALAISGSLIVFINFFAAHYRELAVLVDDFDEAHVLSRMLSEPFNLSLQSYVLLILGVLFAIYAVYKGYTASDPFPGYEKQHRRYKEPQERKAYLTASIHGDLDAIRQADIVNVADYPLATREVINGIRQSHKMLLSDQEKARNLDERDSTAGTNSITRFRTLNAAIRTDGVTPAYFAQPPDFTHLLNGRGGHDELGGRIETAVQIHNDHAEQIQTLVTRLLKRIEAAKDNTTKIMAAFQKSFIDHAALPDLSEFRHLIEDPDKVPQQQLPRDVPKHIRPHPTIVAKTQQANQ